MKFINTTETETETDEFKRTERNEEIVKIAGFNYFNSDGFSG